ncbi:hypothetical protein V757_06445 [Pelistega indica]|uniref:RNA polymerase sigma-70 region 2 domain-containing protein n=1 Tax=Pelistega indica TaxID=1414851 RepID=V8G6L1_9BURK|nr:sigma factor [Pelistega indica]ETD71721.1 hypothetical protein V757_06445 [Pelistega indica]
MDQDKNNFQYAKELKAIAKGNKKSFQTLYNQEVSWMLTFAFKVLRNYKLAEDAVVETFKIIWNNAQYYEESLNHPRGWIYTIFRFHLQNTIRKNYQTIKESKKEPDNLMSEICTNLYAGVNQFVEPGSFYQVFEELPEETQKTLITTYFSGRSLADTATLLSMPLGRLKENIQMGLRYLTQKRSTFQDIKHDHTVFIGEFVLGGLTEAEQNKAHALLNEDPIAEKLTFVWEEEFLHFLNQLILEKAPDNLWVRIKQATLPEKDSSIDTNELDDELALTENADQSNKFLFRLKKFWISRNFWRYI